MNSIRGVLPGVVMGYVDGAVAFGSSVAEQVQQKYAEGQGYLQRLVENHLPEHMQAVAIRVTKSIPQTLFCLSILSDVAIGITAFLWTAHAVWVILPIAKEFLSRQSKDAVPSETSLLQPLRDMYEGFKPAVMLASAIASAAYLVFGVINANVTLLMYSSCFALCSFLSYESMQEISKPVAPSAPSTPLSSESDKAVPPLGAIPSTAGATAPPLDPPK